MAQIGVKADSSALIKHLAEILTKHGDITQYAFTALPEREASVDTYQRHFGSWARAKELARELAGLPAPAKEEKKTEPPDYRVKTEKLLQDNPLTLEEICNTLDLSPKRTLEVLEAVAQVNKGLTKVGRAWVIEDPLFSGPDDEVFKTGPMKYGRFGVVSDTHLGSKYMQLSRLIDFYERCYALGVDFILHTGDMTEGDGTLYRGQRFEMFLHGYADQRDFAQEYYPVIAGAPTKVIAGNHDESFLKSAHVDIVQEIAKEREDLEYLGRCGAYIYLDDRVKTYLLHPDGGVAYAISYKAQKLVEGFTSESKPQVFFYGHYHIHSQFFIRNIHTIGVPCYQSQTPYLRRKGKEPQLGGWIVEFNIGADGWSLEEVSTRFIPVYRPIKDDYKNYPL